jgi:3-deoxy-manno-octulosonate cytidylyltransferase (CMP-KDO synthetase)
MVQRVFEQANKSPLLDKVIIATESKEVKKHTEEFGGEAVLTSDEHSSGTDRCFEALTSQKEVYDYVINIQGDEPFIAPTQIDELAQLLDGKIELATLIKKITSSAELFNYNEVKTIFNKNMEALYFSRQPIPYCRNTSKMEWLNKQNYYKHIGIYAYRTDTLEKISKFPISSLEKAELLEQLRWIENGLKIKLAYTKHESICIDTKKDLDKVLANIDYFL